MSVKDAPGGLHQGNLADLPVEILCDILAYLDAVDIVHCSIANSHIRRIINDSSRLQYTLELSKRRMTSTIFTSRSQRSYAQRLSALRTREERWKNLSYSRLQTIKLPNTGQVYEFMGGVYGNGREEDQRITGSIAFYDLPRLAYLDSVITELEPWTHTMYDLSIIDFTMDPEQDLLLLVALAPSTSKYMYQLHLRTLSTNEPHPRASSAVLDSFPRTAESIILAEHTGGVRVQVSGDLIALLIKEILDGVSGHLDIWNWNSDPHFSSSLTGMTGIDDFQFLSQDTFLLVRPTGYFEVYTFEDPKLTPSIPILCATYSFPPLNPGYAYWYISLSSNPSPGFTVKDQDLETSSHRASEPDYHPCMDQRMLACCLYAFKPSTDFEHRIHSFVFFIPAKKFLDDMVEWRITHSNQSQYSRLQQSSSYASTQSTVSSDVDSLASIASQSASSDSDESLSQYVSYLQNEPSELTDYYEVDPDSTDPIVVDAAAIISGLLPPTFAPSYSMPRHAAPSTPSRSERRPSRPIPWDEWGPHNTRWFSECQSTDWQHALHGLRTADTFAASKVNRKHPIIPPPSEHNTPSPSPTPSVESTPSPDSDSTANAPPVLPALNLAPLKYIRVRDYNPYVVKEMDAALHTRGKGKSKEVRWGARRSIKEESVTPAKGVFMHDIVSSLPYTEVWSEEPFEVTDVMIDDCRLLLLKRGFTGKLESLDVLSI